MYAPAMRVLIGVLGLLVAGPAAANTPASAGQAGAQAVTEVELVGVDTTDREVIIDLLPRALPATLTADEIRELSRRVKNLGVFDMVEVQVVGTQLQIRVREKRTISPILGLSTGQTLADSTATLGVVDYNLRGRATRAGGKLTVAERGLNFAVFLEQHLYSPNRWARELEIYRLSSGFRFEGTDSEWSRDRTGGLIEWITPFRYSSRLLYEFQVVSYYENASRIVGARTPDSGLYVGGLFEVIYDAFRWDDLLPSGYKLVLEMRPGVFTAGRFRGEARIKGSGGYHLTDRAALLVNANMAAVNPGDVNHSLLIGSQQGVRGLPDSLYRSAFAAYANVELRHSLRIHGRTYLQSVAFADGAVFRPMDPDGELLPWTSAVGTGVGLRLVPTALTNLVLRGDLARLHVPDETWLAQVGLSQYF